MSNLQLAYLAGLMDGEGSWSIGVDKRYTKKDIPSIHFNPRMTMSIKFGTDVLYELKEVFGGQIYAYGEDGKKWYLGKRLEIISASNLLLPYLRIKKNVCERTLYALSIFPEVRANHLAGERSWAPEVCLEVAEIALTLNPESSRKTEKKINYLNTIKEMYNELNKI